MSKKDQKKAEKEGPFRGGHRGASPAPEGKQWVKCLYPPCNAQVLIEKEVISPIGIIRLPTTLPMCKVHGEMCMFVMWILPMMQIQRGVTPQGIVVPGQGQPGGLPHGPMQRGQG